MNAKTDQKNRSHETILDSAARLLREKGISGARVADVMKGAGLTVGGFYAHFASKEALVDETLRRTACDLRSRLFDGLGERSPAERTELVLKRYLSRAHRDSFEDGCPFPAVVSEVATTAPEHRPVLGEQVSALAAELEDTLPDDAALPKKHLALALVALMVGGLGLARALAATPASDDVLKACRALGTHAARPR